MLKKFLLTNFISASLLISTCGAMDLEREDTSLTLSVKKLEKGYNLGLTGQSLELKDGTKWLVQNQSSWSIPNFVCLYGKQKFNGIHNQQQKMFYFEHSSPGGFEQKWNEELQGWEDDYEKPIGMMEYFNLNVKQIIEEKAVILKIEEKKPQQYITIGDMQVPCVWNPQTQQMVLDFSSIPQLANLLNAKFNPSQQEKPAVLLLENEVSDLKVEEVKESEDKTTSSLPLAPEIMVKESIAKSIEKISSFTVIKEPSNFTIKHTPVHVSYDDKRNVWTITERITPLVRDWLNTRLGWDAYLQCDKMCQHEIQKEMNMTEEERLLMIESQNKFDQAMGDSGGSSSSSTRSSYVLEAESFMQKRHNNGADVYSSKEYTDFTKLYEQSGMEFSTSNDDYLSAWRGFDYNLNHADKVPTYISCILSQPFKGNSIIELSPLSVDVQILMTGTLSENFYNPLGIYASPIARAYNRLTGNTNNKNLSPIIHKGMALALCEANPNAKVVIVRPIHSMATIFKKSDIPFTISNGYPQNVNMPYIRSLQPIQHRWYDSKVELKGEEKEQFGDSLFTLIDPRTNDYYQIGNSHPFSQSPFLGGISRDNIEAFPFFTIDVNDLKKI